MISKLRVGLLLVGLTMAMAFAAETRPVAAAEFTRSADVIYGRKFGTALTLDVFAPAKPNGAGVLFLMSGGWVSNQAPVNARSFEVLLARGYTVFTVWHGSQPKYIVPEIMEDIHRAARFVRANAARFAIDPQRLGVTGTSSGGHLSLLLGLMGGPGKSDAKDVIDRESSAVQAVACFCPPTDFANWTKAGDDLLIVNPMDSRYAGAWRPLGDTREGRVQLWREWSPIHFVKAGAPPIFVIHGDADRTVPIYQAKAFAEACRAARVPHTLVVREGKDHTWPEMAADRAQFADWFDRYLRANAN
jgi:acetyl esterase/lipase